MEAIPLALRIAIFIGFCVLVVMMGYSLLYLLNK